MEPENDLGAAGQAALRAYPQLRGLVRLRSAGWAFSPRTDSTGEVVELSGVRSWPEGYADAILIRYVTDAAALRADHTGAVVWQLDGTLTEVVDGLLHLPAPDSPSAPRLALGAAPRLWTP